MNEKIKVGDRIRLSESGKEIVLRNRKPYRLGTVVGFSIDKRCVRIHWDGTKKNTTSTYYSKFIEKVEKI